MSITTREERNAYQRAKRKANGNAATHKYEKTKKGFLMRKYRNMQSRVNGIQKQKRHLYRDLELLPREQFYDWALAHPLFHQMFLTWELSGYDRKLCPTVDRIDPSKGYCLSNMRWLTHSENSALGAANKQRKRLADMGRKELRPRT